MGALGFDDVTGCVFFLGRDVGAAESVGSFDEAVGLERVVGGEPENTVFGVLLISEPRNDFPSRVIQNSVSHTTHTKISQQAN